MADTQECNIPENTNLNLVLSEQQNGQKNGTVKDSQSNDEPKEDEAANEPFQPAVPYDQPVNGGKIAQEIRGTLNKYLVLPKHADTAITLWVLFSYTYDDFDVCPILAITSPEKRCGKTSLLALLTALCQKVLAGSNISPSAVFRSIEKWNPTLLVDEADTFLNQKEELRGILNSGHTRPTAFVTRAVAQGKKFDVKRFSTWTPKAIALIGKLTDTLEDRSIRIKMRRKKKDETRARIHYSQLDDQFEIIRKKIARWAADFTPEYNIETPEKLDDRAADNWLPLLIIAKDVGLISDANKASVALSGTPDTQTYRTMLLNDIQTIFTKNKCDAIFTSSLLDQLTDDPEKPWGEFSRGNPMTARKLASMLKPFDVGSENLTINGNRRKGYTKKSFKDAFDRYL